jgi:murein DD-endopeptidase MepM/ murein hydrolase activator NlpD
MKDSLIVGKLSPTGCIKKEWFMKRKGIHFCWLLFLVALLPAGALAKNIYKYQDENGIWHFTDRAPDEDIEFSTVYMETEPEPRIRLRREGKKENPIYVLFNDFWGPVEVELTLTDTDNVLSEPELPARFVIPAQTEQTLVGIGAVDQHRGFSYRIGMSAVPGPPISAPVEGLVILPPFSAGEEYSITQGFGDNKTHDSPDSSYAIDIAMPVGSAVHAVRKGTVMDVEEDFNRGGNNYDKFIHKVNRILILHEDGTMALYAHLDLASVSVRPGARVRAGQMIARSGNTGFTSGPHLHFSIQQNSGMQTISLPFRFRTPEGTAVAPLTHEYVQGVSPSI